jgi:hypothetical protein
LDGDGNSIPRANNSPEVSLTPLLDGNGNPHLGVDGKPLYIETGSTSRQIVELANNRIQSYLDAVGDTINVAEPLGANGEPIDDSSGNPTLVIGRNIDANGSGVIGQNVFLEATGYIVGLFVGQYVTFNPGSAPPIGGSGPIIYSQSPPTISGPDGLGAVPETISSAGSSAPPPTAPAQTVASTADNVTAVVAKTENQNDGSDDDEKKKHGNGISLAQKVSQVTVLLPKKD